MRVLFIGNSYTQHNDLPAVVAAVTAQTGSSIEVESVLVGGATLWDHWSVTEAVSRIDAGGFDTVVLQGQSLETVYSGRGFSTAAENLAGKLQEANAHGVWFSTWPRRADHEFYERPHGIGTPASLAARIEVYYRTAAHHNSDYVARVGAAWVLALDELPEVALHADDGSHPSAAGTLLAACVLAQGLTGMTPRVPVPVPLGIPLATARDLCAIASRVACPDGLTFCDASCVGLRNNPYHCSACGNTCPGEEPCIGGVCGCPVNLTACARRCVDLATSSYDCGTCGNHCDGGGITCQEGVCLCESAADQWASAQTLTTLRPECEPFSEDLDGECNAAIHAYCADQGCFTSGFGSSFSPGPGLRCVSDDVHTTTYAQLSSWVSACNGVTERVGANCSSAIHRYCVSSGATSGFGPVDSDGDTVVVTCVAAGAIEQVDFATLTDHFNGKCDGIEKRWGPDCTTAVSFWCQAQGHANGYGPVEWSGNTVGVMCVED